MISLVEYPFGGDIYLAALELRREVLRRPLGLEYAPEDLALEVTDIHIGALDGPDVVGTLILTPKERVVKMRQVAVASNRQGTGIGRMLVEFAEALAAQRSFLTMTLHARDSAVPFYVRLGYELYGEPFTEVMIPHRSMRKTLLN